MTGDSRPLPPPTRGDLLKRLTQALVANGLDHDIREMRLMADTGLAHHHVWLRRSTIDWVARLPKQSQMGLSASENLDYQAACFRRASRSGHAPGLHAVLPPDKALPRGGLLVSAVRGRVAHLPEDLPAIAEALARLHSLEPPLLEQRPPLLAPHDPWAAMRGEIDAQAGYLVDAGLSTKVQDRLRDELDDLPDQLPRHSATEPRLISFDAHPGNFLVTDSGRAVLVDLEKCRYGLPGFDLAHATLYTSTTWDVDSHAVLDADGVARFYQHWEEVAGLPCDPGVLLACRRSMWLWSLTWCAKWRVLEGRERDTRADGEDWSAALSEDALVAHVRDRVDHYLALDTIERVRHECRLLTRLLGDR